MRTELNNLKPSQKGRILSVKGGHSFESRLRTLGIRKGKEVRAVAQHPWGPVVIEVDGRQTAIGRGMAAKIIVEVGR